MRPYHVGVLLGCQTSSTRFLLAISVVCACVGAVGCFEDDGKTVSEEELAAAQKFEDFQIVFLGEKFDGLPLGSISLEHGTAFITYGERTEESGVPGSSGDLEILIERQKGVGDLSDLAKFGGNPGKLFPDEGVNGFVLGLFSRRLRVEIDGENRAQVTQAANALQPLNDPPKGKPRLFSLWLLPDIGALVPR